MKRWLQAVTVREIESKQGLQLPRAGPIAEAKTSRITVINQAQVNMLGIHLLV